MSLGEERMFYKADNIAKFQKSIQKGLTFCIGISSVTFGYEFYDEFLNTGFRILYGAFIGGLVVYL